MIHLSDAAPLTAGNSFDADRCLRAPSGMGVTLLPRPPCRTFAAALTLRAGFRLDPEGREGLSHLLEHLAFAGKQHERLEALSRQGMAVNGTTGHERVVFWVAGPAEMAAEGVAFLRAFLSRPPVTKQELDHELAIIEQESVGRAYTPWNFIYDGLVGNVVLGPGRWLGLLSNVEAMKKLTLAEVNEAMPKMFRPADAWLTIAAPDPAAVAGDALEGASALGPADREPVVEGEPPALPPVIVQRFKKCPQVVVYRCFHHRPPGVYPSGAIATLCDLIGGGTHAELYRRLRSEGGMAYDCGLDAVWFEDCGLIVMHAAVDHRRAADAVERVNAVCERARAGFSPDEVEESRSRLTRGLDMMAERAEHVCEFMANRVRWDGRPPRTVAEVIRAQKALTRDEVNRTAERMFRPERCVTVVCGGMGFLMRRRLRRLAAGAAR